MWGMTNLPTQKAPGRLRNRPLKDYSGERFGRLTAVSLVERELEQNNHLWRFLCDCGTVKDLRIKAVRSGNTSSCGCLAKETITARNSTHGLSQANRREYRSWKDMRGRCHNPNDSDFANYGERGIVIAPEWDDFAQFLADMGKRPDGMTLDRIDVNGDYTPANCRWASSQVQANNKRNNHSIEWDEQTQTLQAWCDQYQIDPSKARYRLSRGWPLERVFSAGDFRIDGSKDRHG